MPDQTTPNPTGGNTQPPSSAAQSIQAAQESAWLQMRDQAKTPADVSRMMVDLSADDFNALGAQISEAKRYGRKEVSYKGHSIPVPDKPFSAIKKVFEEKQSQSKSQIEQASTGLSQQIFGNLGNILGGKKKEEGGKKKETGKGAEKRAEEKPTASADGATVRETAGPDLAAVEAPTVRVEDLAEKNLRNEPTTPAAKETGTLKGMGPTPIQPPLPSATRTLRGIGPTAPKPDVRKRRALTSEEQAAIDAIQVAPSPVQTTPEQEARYQAALSPQPIQEPQRTAEQIEASAKSFGEAVAGAGRGRISLTPEQEEELERGAQAARAAKSATQGALSTIGTAPSVGAAGIAAGVAGAALGAATETKSQRTTSSRTAGSSTVQPQKTTTTTSQPTTAKATISTEAKTQVQGTPTTQGRPSATPGRQVTADIERKVEIEGQPATPPPPAAGGPTRVEAKIEKDVSIEARQQARAGFGIPGAPPPSPPSGGAPGGPKGPSRIPTPRELLSRSDTLMAETKALSGRMARNPKDVMLKAQARILREHTDSLIDQLQTTQQQGTLLEPEQTGLEELGMRLGVLSGALGGEPGMGQATELGVATGLYDQQRARLGGNLAPDTGAAQPRPSGGPKPTGGAGPSPVTTPIAAGGGKAFPGPQAPRPMAGPASRGGRGSQLGTAMQLGAMQQQATAQAGQGEPEIVSDDSVPQDVRAQILGEGGGQRASSVLPGQYAPPGYEDVYGGGRGPQHRARAERMPGSAVGEEEELTEAELTEGGGEIGSDEAERARVLAEQQSQARRAADFSGVAGVPGIPGPGAGAGRPPQRQAPPQPQPKPQPVAGAKGGAAGGGPGAVAGILAMQQALSLSAQQEQSRFRRMQAVKNQIEGLRNAQRSLQNIWRVVNASELASSEAVFPIIMWVITSNLQLLNKLSFKVKFIPPASIPEDGLTFCVDCLLGSACLLNMVWYMGITVLIALPYIIIGTAVGAEGFDIILKALDMLAGWIS